MWVIFLLVTVAFFTLAERKLMGAVQRRKGPDVVGFWGALQPAADGMKLVLKELIFPLRATLFLFLLGPIFVFTLSLMGWAVIPLTSFSFLTTIHIAILYTLVAGGLNIYGIILAGWASNSRYAFLGGVRATAQMISYELVLGTVNLFIAFYAGSYNYIDIVNAQKNIWFILPLFPVFVLYLIVMLAETNRTPFDLAEAEAELVAGYNVEYSSIMFAMFFLGEYANMILLSVICVLYFFGGWLGFGCYPALTLILKVLVFCIFFVWIRATLPRYRYDQLMEYGWKHLLPFSFGLLIFLFGLCLLFQFRVGIFDFSYTQKLLYSIYIIQKPTSLQNITQFTETFLNLELENFLAQYFPMEKQEIDTFSFQQFYLENPKFFSDELEKIYNFFMLHTNYIFFQTYLNFYDFILQTLPNVNLNNSDFLLQYLNSSNFSFNLGDNELIIIYLDTLLMEFLQELQIVQENFPSQAFFDQQLELFLQELQILQENFPSQDFLDHQLELFLQELQIVQENFPSQDFFDQQLELFLNTLEYLNKNFDLLLQFNILEILIQLAFIEDISGSDLVRGEYLNQYLELLLQLNLLELPSNSFNGFENIAEVLSYYNAKEQIEELLKLHFSSSSIPDIITVEYLNKHLEFLLNLQELGLLEYYEIYLQYEFNPNAFNQCIRKKF